MSSYDTWHNLLSGISQGSFDKIYIRDASGNVVDILSLLAGANGTVTSASLPLSINSGVLSLDLSGFCTSASTPLSLTSGQMTIDLTSYSTTSQMNAAVTAAQGHVKAIKARHMQRHAYAHQGRTHAK